MFVLHVNKTTDRSIIYIKVLLYLSTSDPADIFKMKRKCLKLSTMCFCLATYTFLHNGLILMIFSRRTVVNTNNERTFFNVTLTNTFATKNQMAYSHQLETMTTDNNSLEVQHIAFLKVHKAASSTIQNMLYRFGLKRKLSFVLPTWRHYISTEKNVHKEIYPATSKSGKYDILCNHAVFNEEHFRRFMYPDAVYFSIVREPFDLFISAAMYYKFRWMMGYLKRMNRSTFIEELITHPEIHEPTPLSESRTFNYMSRDFGWIFSSVLDAQTTSMEDFESHLTYIDRVFDLVLVVERFDESLILLKRRLAWTIRDILYIRKNARSKRLRKHIHVKNETLDLFKQVYRFDYRLYDFFKRRLNERIISERDLQDEVESFRIILMQVEKFCKASNDTKEHIEKTAWNEAFDLTKDDCCLMLMDELPFFANLKWLYYGIKPKYDLSFCNINKNGTKDT